MPTYDYKCNDCGNIFELFQPMSAEPIKVCTVCGGSVKRLIGAGAGPIFKGSGFYQTDYKSTKKSDATKSGTSEKPAAKQSISDSGSINKPKENS